MTSWRLAVDTDACIGSGACAATAPVHFRLDRIDGQDRAVPLSDLVEPDDDALGAALSCPVEAISVIEEPGGVVLAPEQ